MSDDVMVMAKPKLRVTADHRAVTRSFGFVVSMMW